MIQINLQPISVQCVQCSQVFETWFTFARFAQIKSRDSDKKHVHVVENGVYFWDCGNRQQHFSKISWIKKRKAKQKVSQWTVFYQKNLKHSKQSNSTFSSRTTVAFLAVAAVIAYKIYYASKLSLTALVRDDGVLAALLDGNTLLHQKNGKTVQP